MPAIPVLGRVRQEVCHEPKAGLDCIVNSRPGGAVECDPASANQKQPPTKMQLNNVVKYITVFPSFWALCP